MPRWEEDAIAPGGNGSGISIQGLEDKCHDQLRENPSARGGRLLMGQATEFEQLFESLKSQLDLPAVAVQFDNFCRFQHRFRQGGKLLMGTRLRIAPITDFPSRSAGA